MKRIFLAISVLGLVLYIGNCGPNKEPSSEFLFSGEFLVESSGIYTFAHYYYHPEIGREVIIVGMNHGGDKSYYQKINRILSPCNFIFYEDIKTPESAPKIDLDKLFSKNPDMALLTAIRIYFIKASKALNLTSERSMFNYRELQWVLGDVQLSKQEVKEIMHKFLLQIQTISYQRKKEMVDYIKRAITKMEQGEFTKRDFGESFVLFYSDPNIVRAFTRILATPRDKYLFQKFDSLIQEKNPKVIGIKFGAAHIAFQRSLLEQRGYIHRAKKKLCNLKF